MTTKSKLSNAKEFEDFLMQSCPPSESTALGKYSLADIKGYWLRKKCEAWFADMEIFRWYNSIKEKAEKEIFNMEKLKDDLDAMSSSKTKVEDEPAMEKKKVDVLKKEIDEIKASVNSWEVKSWEEHAC